MAEPQVNIHLSTTANTAGAQAATRSLATLEQEARQLSQQMRQLAADSDAFNETRLRLNGLNDEIRMLKTGKDAAARSAGSFGQAMLQGSRGIQDFAAAGIPGVVNNLEGLATALGMTAGAAGGITLVAVGLDLLVRNWDKIKTAFGSQEEVQALWMALTPDEAAVQRLRDFNEALENQALQLERVRDARLTNIEAERQQDAMMEKRKAVWKGLVPTPEERGDLPPLPGTEAASPAMREAQRKVQEAAAGTQAAMGQFNALDQAVAAQQKRLELMQRIAESEQAGAADQEALRKVQQRIAMAGQGGGVASPALFAQQQAIQERIAAQNAARQGMINQVPGLMDGLTGDPEKDRKTLQQRAADQRTLVQDLERQRLQAAQAAEQAARQQALAEQVASGQAALEAEQRGRKAQDELGLPPAIGTFAGADERGGILPAVQQQNEAVRTAIQQATQTLQSNGAAIEQGLSEVNRGLAGNMSTLVREIAALKSTVQSQAAEIENLRANAR